MHYNGCRRIMCQSASSRISCSLPAAGGDPRHVAVALQAGRPVQLAPEQKRLITAGLSLHQQGQAQMEARSYAGAPLRCTMQARRL
jgi:hypothetical protein